MPLTQNALNMLAEQGTQLFLGLVHASDEAESRMKVEIARYVFAITPLLQWGIATEYGWGRTPKSQIESIIDISARFAAPVKGLVVDATGEEARSPSQMSDGSAYFSA